MTESADREAAFIASCRTTARLAAQDVAEGYFKPDDLLYVAEAGNVPAQPGLALSFGKTVAQKAADTAFDLGRQAERELALLRDSTGSAGAREERG